MEPAGSVLVAFAAKEGTTASDGTGRNSPFTAALLRHIETPGLEVNYLFRNVREAVLNATNSRQEPVVYGALPSAEIYFKPGAKPAVAAPLLPVDQAGAWTATPNATRRAVLEDLPAIPSAVRPSSHALLNDLRTESATAAPPGPPAPPPPPAKLAVVAPPTVSPIPSGGCGGGLTAVSASPRTAVPLSSTEECALKPGDAFKECIQCPEMMVVPAGAFTMGRRKRIYRDEDEGPLHQRDILRPCGWQISRHGRSIRGLRGGEMWV